MDRSLQRAVIVLSMNPQAGSRAAKFERNAHSLFVAFISFEGSLSDRTGYYCTMTMRNGVINVLEHRPSTLWLKPGQPTQQQPQTRCHWHLFSPVDLLVAP